MKTPQSPKIEAYICNNPHCHWTVVNPITGRENRCDAFPVVCIDVGNIPNTEDDWRVSAKILNSLGCEVAASEFTVAADGGHLRYWWRLDDPVDDPWMLAVCGSADSGAFEEMTGLRAYKLSGRVTDFEGEPIHGHVVANSVPEIIVPTSETGEYTMWLPNRFIPSICAVDAGFGTTTLECWVYAYKPEGDLTLDMRVGQVEMYELNAWRGVCGVKIDFLPMSVGLVNALLNPDHDPKWAIDPDLGPADITVDLDGNRLDIRSVFRHEEYMDREEPAVGGFIRHEYMVQASEPAGAHEGPRGGTQILRVAVKHEIAGATGPVVEHGEGLFLGLVRK
jgi:hypothetical protein